MKKLFKATMIILLLSFLATGISCRSHKTCRAMRFHNSDISRGLAH